MSGLPAAPAAGNAYGHVAEWLRSGLQIRLRLSRSIPVYLRNSQPVGVSWLLQRSLSVSITLCLTLFSSNFGSNGPKLFSYFGALQPERVALCHTCHDGVARPHCCRGKLARGSRPPPRFVQQSVPDTYTTRASEWKPEAMKGRIFKRCARHVSK